MSGDESTERSADHDDAHTSFSKLVEKILMQNGRRGFKLTGTLKRALFQENRVLDPNQKVAGTSTQSEAQTNHAIVVDDCARKR